MHANRLLYYDYQWKEGCEKVWATVHIRTKQRPDQYKMKILVFSIQYDFQILKYQYSIWRILNKYQYAKKTEVSVSIQYQYAFRKKVKKQANQADLTNWCEIKFVLYISD